MMTPNPENAVREHRAEQDQSTFEDFQASPLQGGADLRHPLTTPLDRSGGTEYLPHYSTGGVIESSARSPPRGRGNHLN